MNRMILFTSVGAVALTAVSHADGIAKYEADTSLLNSLVDPVVGDTFAFDDIPPAFTTDDAVLALAITAALSQLIDGLGEFSTPTTITVSVAESFDGIGTKVLLLLDDGSTLSTTISEPDLSDARALAPVTILRRGSDEHLVAGRDKKQSLTSAATARIARFVRTGFGARLASIRNAFLDQLARASVGTKSGHKEVFA